jgi:hypothetical protein
MLVKELKEKLPADNQESIIKIMSLQPTNYIGEAVKLSNEVRSAIKRV